MGNRIEFPYNDQIYYERALEYLKENRFEEALTCVEKVYALNQHPNVNQLYTTILSALKRYDEALDMAQKEKELYMLDEGNAQIYTNLLILNQVFIEAEMLIQQFTQLPENEYTSGWLLLENELTRQRQLALEEKRIENLQTKEDLLRLHTFSASEQEVLLQNAHSLSLEELQEIAPVIFSNTALNDYTYKAFLEVLIEKNDPNEYLFPWFQELRTVQPAALETFQETKEVKSLDNELEKLLHKQPSFIEIVKMEILSDFLSFYPFIGERVTDLNYWIKCYIEVVVPEDLLKMDTTPQTDQQKEIKSGLLSYAPFVQRKSNHQGNN